MEDEGGREMDASLEGVEGVEMDGEVALIVESGRGGEEAVGVIDSWRTCPDLAPAAVD
jgi:hypothetical protein